MAKYSIEFYSKSLLRKVEIKALIPSLNLHGTLSNKDLNYYQNRDVTYPLVIFLCGFGDNEYAWQSNTAVERLCEQPVATAATNKADVIAILAFLIFISFLSFIFYYLKAY